MSQRPPRKKAAPGSARLTPGTLLGSRYQIEKVIGAGGMGAVYSARDRRFRAVVRRCAVKEMYDNMPDGAARQRARENFEREANLLASLNHGAIPKVYDYFTEGDRHYLVYEYIEGQDLARILHQKARPLPPEQVIDWAIQLCKVLETLHASDPPIIFRDLKPSNVMLRQNHDIVLVDFGIAKHFQPVQKGTMIGTEGYAPPEQYEGMANPKVDIYALGATLHQLLTNTDPQEYRPFSFKQRVIRQSNPTVSKEVQSIIMRALAYEPEERWPDMASFRKALERTSRADSAKEDQAAGPEGTGAKDRSSLQGAGSGLFARHLQQKQETASEPPASRLGEGSTNRSSTEAASAGWPPAPGGHGPQQTQPVSQPPSPGATQPVSQPAQQPATPAGTFQTSNSPGGIADEAAIVPRWTFAAEDEIRSTPQAADGLVYVGSYDTNLYCLDAASGEFVWKYATSGGIPGRPTIWKELVIFGSDDHHIYGLNRRTGRMEWTTPTQGCVRSSPRVSVDYVFIGSDDGHVYSLSAMRGHLNWRANIGAPVRSSAAIGEEMLYIGAEDGTVAGINLMNGDIAWRVHAGGPVISSPVLFGSRVIFGSLDRLVYGVDQSSGWVVWRIRLPDRVYSSPFLHENRIYVCTVNGMLYCLDAEWGKEVWKSPLGSQVTSSPTLDTDNNKLFIGSLDGTIFCVDARKGKVNWQFQTGGPIPGSIKLYKDTVLFGSMDHRVYALPTHPEPRTFE